MVVGEVPCILNPCANACQFPWQNSGIGSGSLAARVHYARRYRTAKARVARTEEEKVYLQKEVIRTINWLEEQVAAVQQQLAAYVEAQQPSSSHVPFTIGREALLRRELHVLERISLAASKMRAVADKAQNNTV